MVDTSQYQPKPEERLAANLTTGTHRLQFRDLFWLSLRVFREKALRTFLTILGISMGIGTVLFLVSLGSGLQYILIGQLASTEDSLITLEAFYPSESNLTIGNEIIDEVIALPDTAEVSPVAELSGEVKFNTLSGVLIKVVKPNYFRLSGLQPDIGESFTEQERAVLISNTALKLFGLGENESALFKELSVKVIYENQQDGSFKAVDIPGTLPIKGIVVDEFSPPFIMIPYDMMPEKPPFFHRMLIKARDIERVEPLRDQLIEKGFLISARIDLVNQAKQILNVITIVLGIFGVTALVVSAIGMFNTMIIGFLERIFEVGIMKSLGATVQDIRNLFLMESLIMGLLGGIGGIVVGVGAGELFNFGLNILANQLGGKSLNLFIYPVQFIVFILVVSGIVGISSGFWPARRAAKLSPKEAFIRK